MSLWAIADLSAKKQTKAESKLIPPCLKLYHIENSNTVGLSESTLLANSVLWDFLRFKGSFRAR